MVYLDGSMTSEPGLRKQIQEKWPSKQDDVFGVHHLDVFIPNDLPFVGLVDIKAGKVLPCQQGVPS